MTREETATALAEAMRAHVADVEAPPGFLRDVRARDAARRRAALTVGAVAAAVLTLVAGGAVVARRVAAPPAPVAPTASASPAAPAARPRMEPTWLPPGFYLMPGSRTSGPPPREPGDPDVWVESVRYETFDARSRIHGVLVLETWSGEITPPSAGYYHEQAYERTARQVRIGSRTVWHLRNHLPKGLDVYQWLEAPGVLVDVTGMGDVTDAEVRRFVEGLRRVA